MRHTAHWLSLQTTFRTFSGFAYFPHTWRMGSQPYSHNISNPWLTTIRPTFNPTRVRSNTRNPLPFSCSKLLRQLSKGPENRWLICNKYKNMKTSFEVSIGSYTRKWPFIIVRGLLLLVFINKISSRRESATPCIDHDLLYFLKVLNERFLHSAQS